MYRTLSMSIVIFLCSFCVDVCAAKPVILDPAQVSDLYTQAKDLFRRANEVAGTSPETAEDLYGKAAMRYERIVGEGGIHNGKLYYNLGNVYFCMKDMGRAILNYRRAREYIPHDRNLQQNLQYARKMRVDQIEDKQETQVLKTLFFWHYDTSTETRVFLFVGCFVLVWIFAGIRVFSTKPVLVWCIITTSILSFSLAVSLGADEIFLRTKRPGVIISREVIARKGNSVTYEPSFKEPLHAGTEFTLIENRDEWFQIELADSRTCWVLARDVELVR